MSRVELLAWVNQLLQTNVNKIESLGSGAIYCQIFNTIYGDLEMRKVKLNAKHEYEFVTNFKALQKCFDKHGISNAIPVERLVKCKFQDNIEFLQWVKKFWDQNMADDFKVEKKQKKEKPNIKQLEDERDFYFAKLRDIELLCQEKQDEFSQMILEILYKTEDGFEPPENTF